MNVHAFQTCSVGDCYEVQHVAEWRKFSHDEWVTHTGGGAVEYPSDGRLPDPWGTAINASPVHLMHRCTRLAFVVERNSNNRLKLADTSTPGRMQNVGFREL